MSKPAKEPDASARLAAIVESSDDAIISKDLEGVIVTWNRGAERLFGYTAAEAIGRSVTMLIPSERHDEEPGILERIRRGDRMDHYETVRIRKDGGRVDISLTVSPIFDEQGVVTGASKIARDITESKQTAARIERDRQLYEEQREQLLRVAERAREEAEAANRAKDEFLAMLGHELRNPLSAARNGIAAARLDELRRDRALSIADRAIEQLVRIVDDLLDVARITHGRVPLRKKQLVLGDVLRRTVDAVHGLMDERGHSLGLHLPPEAIHVEADAARLEQAITNLLTNAAKYTDAGGTIALRADLEGDRVAIRVTDNGIGISQEMLPKVFDLFTQGDRSLDRAEGGLGIGLTLVRRIVELHDGTVEARSAGAGLGAEFVIRLPAVQSITGILHPAGTESHEKPRPHAARVLMIEDNIDAAESLGMLLELLGHHVRVVQDGPSGLVAARANLPDVMLVDIGLPGMNGYEVAEAIRSDPVLKRLVLVALTGYGQPEDRTRAMAAGFDYHMVKPVDMEALRDLVGRVADASAEVAAPGVRH